MGITDHLRLHPFLRSGLISFASTLPPVECDDFASHIGTEIRLAKRRVTSPRLKPRILKPAHDSNPWHGVCWIGRAGLRQLSERVPQPLARGRERGEAALALPRVWANSGMVGECAAGELACTARALSDLPRADRLALSAGGTSSRRVMGNDRLTIHQPVSQFDNAWSFDFLQSPLPFSNGGHRRRNDAVHMDACRTGSA